MSRYKTGHKQPRFRYSVLARCVAWANISVQVLFPLAVTFTPVMAARAQHAVQPRLSMGNTTVTADNNVEKNVASFAANAGTFLSSQPDSDATRNFITGMATAKANQEIQEWLGKYGTARVKLNVDKDFSLKDSSLEMLYRFMIRQQICCSLREQYIVPTIVLSQILVLAGVIFQEMTGWRG